MSMRDAAENDGETEEAIKSINEAYASDKQAGQYQNNSIYSQSEVILNAGETENQEHVIFIFGKHLPVTSSTCTKKQLDHFKRYFIFFMDELAENLRDVYELSFFKKTFYKKIQAYVKEISHFRQPHLSRSDDEEERNRDKYRLFGLSLDDMELHEDKQIPVVIVELINYFKSNNDHLDEQGIFRKAPREFDIKELEKQLILKNYKALDLCDDPHVVAACLKRLISQLPEPLFPFSSYDSIKLLQNEISSEVRLRKVISIVQNMPELNSRVLWSLIDLLKLVQQHSDKNLMKIDALTRIIAPALIRRNVKNSMDNPNKSSTNDDDTKIREAIEELKMNPTIVDLTKILFVHFDEVFQGVVKEDNPNFKNIIGNLKEHGSNMDNNRHENQTENNRIFGQQQEDLNNSQHNNKVSISSLQEQNMKQTKNQSESSIKQHYQQQQSQSQQSHLSDNNNKPTLMGDSNSEGLFDFQKNYFSNYKGDFKCFSSSSDRIRRFSRIHFNKISDDIQEDLKSGPAWDSKEQDDSKVINQNVENNAINKIQNLDDKQINEKTRQQTDKGNKQDQEDENEQFNELYGHHRRGIIEDNTNTIQDQRNTQLKEQDNQNNSDLRDIQNNKIDSNYDLEDERIQRNGVRQKSIAIQITDPQQLKLIQESIQNS